MISLVLIPKARMGPTFRRRTGPVLLAVTSQEAGLTSWARRIDVWTTRRILRRMVSSAIAFLIRFPIVSTIFSWSNFAIVFISIALPLPLTIFTVVLALVQTTLVSSTFTLGK